MTRQSGSYIKPVFKGVDAFVHKWSYCDSNYAYAFPPFSIIGRVLQKVSTDQAEIVLVVPVWPTQSWFPRLLSLICDKPILLRSRHKLLTLPHKPEALPPLGKKLDLMACRLSGRAFKVSAFLQELKKSCCSPAETVHGHSTVSISRSGKNLLYQGVSIPLVQE